MVSSETQVLSPNIKSLAQSIASDTSVVEETWVRFTANPEGMSVRVGGIDSHLMPIRELFTEHALTREELVSLLEKVLQECSHSV